MEAFVNRTLLRCFSLLGFVIIVVSAFAQSEFSGEIVQSNDKESKPVKVYFGKQKMRFDLADSGNYAGAGIFDLQSGRYIVLLDKQHMYMDMPGTMLQKSGMFHFFASGDVENACSDWLKLDSNKGGTCHKIGSDVVNGRKTVKYEGTDAKGEVGTVWLDSKVRFPIKWQNKDGGGELRNIQEGPQPASLFEIPPGYSKMDFGAMGQKRK
jgi:hypothetical protein